MSLHFVVLHSGQLGWDELLVLVAAVSLLLLTPVLVRLGRSADAIDSPPDADGAGPPAPAERGVGDR